MSRLAGTVNTRDLGGIPLANGLRLKQGVLFRAAALQDPIPAVVTGLVAAGHRQVHLVDLRAAREIIDVPAEPPVGVRVYRYPVADPEHTKTVPSARNETFFAEHYLRMVASAAPAVRALCLTLVSRSGPVVVGCRLGKDRTGVVVMMALRLLGTPDEWIVDDFGRTATHFNASRKWIDDYARRRGEPPSEVLRRCTLSPAVAEAVLADESLAPHRIKAAVRLDPQVLHEVTEVLSGGQPTR